MWSIGDVERSEKIFNALNSKLAESYHPGQFTVHAFCHVRGWLRNGPPVYVQGSGQFLMAEVHPPKAPPFRFVFQREDVLDVDSHETVLMFIQSLNFQDYERTDSKRYYYQFIPELEDCSGEIRGWEAGTLRAE